MLNIDTEIPADANSKAPFFCTVGILELKKDKRIYKHDTPNVLKAMDHSNKLCFRFSENQHAANGVY